jgi:hypothetical protein
MLSLLLTALVLIALRGEVTEKAEQGRRFLAGEVTTVLRGGAIDRVADLGPVDGDDEDLFFALGQDVSHGAHPIGSVQDRS